ncbi:uroporphyrinogen-iii synthase [Plasmopara halstedii]|uniref:Uroporphyrinogen-iii synthase n=1 Tax=Plasmopara halstedii TaxID=4781 RepID=A0A0P1A9T3_PLAHL|nr:uroporphyrinogen-iii synthase [Plasmopara halstedii]CEG37118.1 uroporphyrinogen-iii synthase [Plasmopara halstedii]|eukprot:XP_024573487.1 uroporphyrinogen-iii synthase [Plasmopara halstedii]
MDASVRGKVLEKLQVKPVYSVGAATSRELLPLGVICKGDDAGSADALCNYLHQRGALPPDAKEKPMIFLCGDKRREVLPNSFRSRGLPLEELVVYQTSAVQNINFPDDCKVPNWIVFFSPSGLNVIKDMALPWKSIRKAAIGKTTASALRQHAVATNEAFWEPDVTASMPDPESLACAIFDFEERNLS